MIKKRPQTGSSFFLYIVIRSLGSFIYKDNILSLKMELPPWSLQPSRPALPSRIPGYNDTRYFGALNQSYMPTGNGNPAGEKKSPVIIALQGEPYSGKTKLANNLVEWLKCPVIRLEEILEVLSPSSESPPTPDRAETIMSQAFDIITQFVKTLTSMRFSVIVDSSLSRRSHLDKLVSLVTDSQEKSRKLSLLIIECKPKLEYTSQMKFEERHPNTFSKWYKPQDWPPEAEFSGRDYTDDDIHPLVSKLVLDPRSSFVISSLVEAVHHLGKERKGHKVEFSDWKSTRHNNVFSPKPVPKVSQHEHSISILAGGGPDFLCQTCGVCQNEITKGSDDLTYRCEACPLVIHSSCAELKVDKADYSHKRYFTPKTFPKFYKREPEPTFFFPDKHVCRYCSEAGRVFSYNCPSCIFECHLKCRLLPTILRHEKLSNGVFFYVKSLSSRNLGNCGACRLKMGNVGYLSRSSTGNYNITYHPECLFLPPFIREHEHGGYTHDLEMIFCREKELEDYMCHLCFKTLHPESWYYWCKHCHLEFHLDCAFKEFT